MHADFIALINARRGNKKSIDIVCTQFDAIFAKFQSHGDDISFFEPLLAPQFFNAAHVEDNQLVSILSACVNNIQATEDIDTSTKNSVFIKNISYSNIAGVLRQCDSQDNG